MTTLQEFRQTIKTRFQAGEAISSNGFWGQFSTADLLRARAGLERHFDLACGGDPYRPPKEHLQDQIATISHILDDREAERPRTAEEKMWDAVEGRMAKKITKFNR